MSLATLRNVLLLGSLVSITGCLSQSLDDDDPPPAPDSMSEAAMASNSTTAFNYFVKKGLTKIQAAGIVGNLMQESSVSPTVAQYGGGPGRGIAQWSVGGRWDTSKNDNVAWYAIKHGESKWALGTQLDFVWYELTAFGYGYSRLKSATTLSGAVAAFQDDYEICGECDATKRLEYAQEVLDAHGGGGGSSGKSCFSGTLDKTMPDNACVQSKYDGDWYQCDNGSWVDRWTDPDSCDGVHPL
jgi:hypothetical protein|nr:phage tail tip lysozyme [Kofleriaceae bacterium]